jgi:hypothetical protein
MPGSSGSIGTGSAPGGMGVGNVGAVPPLMETLINQARSALGSSYEDALKRTRDAYANSAEGRGLSLTDQIRSLGENLGNLGLEFQGSDLEQDWQASDRALQEAADLALANDVAYLEKRRLPSKVFTILSYSS